MFTSTGARGIRLVLSLEINIICSCSLSDSHISLQGEVLTDLLIFLLIHDDLLLFTHLYPMSDTVDAAKVVADVVLWL